MEHQTWILVADGSRGRVFAPRSDGRSFDSPLEEDFVATRLRTRDLVSDRAGQTSESHSHGGHAKGKAVDPKQQVQREHAHRIAQVLRTARAEGRFDRLVLVAPPRFLGLLRSELDEPTRAMVVASHAKDIAALDLPRMTERLRELL